MSLLEAFLTALLIVVIICVAYFGFTALIFFIDAIAGPLVAIIVMVVLIITLFTLILYFGEKY